MNREPMVFFVAGMIFGCVLGYMVASAGGGSAPVPVVVSAAQGAPAGATARGGPQHAPQALDPNELRALESLADRDKTNAQVRVELGNLLMDHERWEGAARWYGEALALRPGVPDVLVDQGACLVNMGKPEEGLARFEEALRKDPAHKKAMFNKGVALMEAGRPRDAAAVWEELLKRNPDDPQLAGLRARIDQVRAAQKAS